MSDAKMILVVLLDLLAVVIGGLALWLFFDTLAGIGAGGLALTGTPIGALAVLCGLAVAAIVLLFRSSDGDGR